MSWAAVAKSTTAPPAPTEAPPPKADERIAVVDTNAIISGLRLDQLADRFCTIPEVLAEVRDNQSRAFLSTLPFSLDVREPSDESIKAVQRFARETGDIHSLSAVDLKLLALAHTLELAAHGTIHVREHPVQVRTRQKHKSRPRALPGWGNVTNPEEWRVVDEAPEEMLTNAEGGQSRIIAAVQSLTLGAEGLDTSTASTDGARPAGGAVPSAAFAATLAAASGNASQLTSLPTPGARAGPEPPQQQGQQQGQYQQPAQAPATSAGVGGSDDGEGDEDGEYEEDAGGWETVSKSRNAARRKQRKARRHQAWLEQQQQQQQPQQGQGSAASPPGEGQVQLSAKGSSEGTAAALLAAQDKAAEQQEKQEDSAAKGTAASGAAEAEVGAAKDGSSAAGPQQEEEEEEGGSEGEDGEEEEQDEDEEEEGEDEGEEGEEFEGLELVTDEEGYDDEEPGEDGSAAPAERDDGAASEAGTAVTVVTDATATATATSVAGAPSVLTDGELLPNTTSNVFSVTADFAMQNVILQMGLRLITRDGKQINRVSRWALRCSACFFVTKEAGRLFCPRCGNMTMDKVEVTVGPGGAEFFGVRKKFILRGTKYSLPKPKSGRKARFNPVLREDVMMARMGGKARAGAGKTAPTGELEPFAPEYGSETWHQVTGGGRSGGRSGGRGAGGVPMTSWKNNPNEVKPQRKSRRK